VLPFSPKPTINQEELKDQDENDKGKNRKSLKGREL